MEEWRLGGDVRGQQRVQPCLGEQCGGENGSCESPYPPPLATRAGPAARGLPGMQWDGAGQPQKCSHTGGPWEGQSLLLPLPVSTCQSWEVLCMEGSHTVGPPLPCMKPSEDQEHEGKQRGEVRGKGQ